MAGPELVVSLLLAVLLALLLVRRRVASGNRQPPASDPPAPMPASPRRDTALDDLRAMREALKPAEHSRIERRRAGGSGQHLGQERRKAKKPQASLPHPLWEEADEAAPGPGKPGSRSRP